MVSEYLKSISGKLAELRYEAERLIGANGLPDEDDCDKDENEIYADLANLANSIGNIGIKSKVPDEMKVQLSGGGSLVIYDKRCSDYPGCGVQYEAPSGDRFDVVLVEAEGPEDSYDPDKIRVYVYGDEESDDYTDKFEVSRELLERITIVSG